MAVVPAASVVTLGKAVVPPTVPPKVVVPAVLTVSEKAPLTVEAKLIFPLPVLVRVGMAPSGAAALLLVGPVVVKKTPLMAVVPAASVGTLVKTGVPPTVPP